MACALPWVMREAQILNIFQHCPGKWGEGEVMRNVAKKYNLYISGPNVLNFEFAFFLCVCLIIFMDLFMPVQGCGRTQSLTTKADTYFFAVPLCTFLCCMSAASCICHQTMYCSSFPNGWPSMSMCQKCTGAGASFHAGSCSACRLCVCHCFWIFYHTQNMPMPV